MEMNKQWQDMYMKLKDFQGIDKYDFDIKGQHQLKDKQIPNNAQINQIKLRKRQQFSKLKNTLSQTDSAIKNCEKKLDNVEKEINQYFQKQDALHLEIQKLKLKRQSVNNQQMIVQEGSTIEQNSQCIYCKKNQKSHAVIPCGHMFCCTECVPKKTFQCPICRKKAKCIQKIYLY